MILRRGVEAVVGRLERLRIRKTALGKDCFYRFYADKTYWVRG
jgi:hypothetical protein